MQDFIRKLTFKNKNLPATDFTNVRSGQIFNSPIILILIQNIEKSFCRGELCSPAGDQRSPLQDLEYIKFLFED